MDRSLTHLTSAKRLNSLRCIVTGNCMQVRAALVCKNIFRWACLQASHFLNKGRDIPEFAAL